MTTQWNRSDFNAAYNISDNGLLVAKGGSAGNATNCGRANTFKSSGKWVFSFIYYSTASDGIVGIANSSASLGGYIGQDTNSAGYGPGGGLFYYNGSSTASTAAASGSTVDIAFDLGAKLMWARVNGGSWLPSGNPASGTGGFSFGVSGAVAPAVYSYGPGTEFDANFGAYYPTYAAPTGFSYFDSYAPPTSAAAWSSLDTASNYALSNSNLTATKNSSTAATSLRSALYESSGTWFFSATYSGTSGDAAIGIANLEGALNNYLGLSAGGGGYYADDRIIFNGSTIGSYSTYNPGDIVDVAFSITAKLVWWRVNGGSWLPSGSPSTLTGGQSFSAWASPNVFIFGFTNTTGIGLTLNVGPTFTYAPPSGYTAFGSRATSSTQNASKFLAYTALDPATLRMSKNLGASLLLPKNIRISKLVGYAVLMPGSGAQDPQLIIMS